MDGLILTAGLLALMLGATYLIQIVLWAACGALLLAVALGRSAVELIERIEHRLDVVGSAGRSGSVA